MSEESETMTGLQRSQAHPWHGLRSRIGETNLKVFIENVQFDEVKYEVDRESGLLRIDQPLQTSSLPPYAYGFIPQTLCGGGVAELTKRSRGDNAPLDAFVLSERALRVPGVIADVRLVGGIRVRDENLVDDKLLTVLTGDAALSGVEDINGVPIHMLERINHFLVESSLLGSRQVGEPFGRDRALEILTAAIGDYQARYGEGP